MSEPTSTQPLSDAEKMAIKQRSIANGVLVGLDGSSGSLHALKWAAARTRRFGLVQPLTTWHCPWWSYIGPTAPPTKEFERQAEQQAMSVLASIPTDRHLPLILCQGQAGPTLAEVGTTSNLIVVGTRGRSGLKDTLLGSVSSHVVAYATRPVAVVPANAPIQDVHNKVVVGADGSSNSIEALVWALEHTADDSTIEVVHTWTYPASALPEMTLNPRSDYEAGATAILNNTVNRALEAVRATGGAEPAQEIVRRLEYGDARSVLRECQDENDLLILGARGRGAVAHMLIGSVASALVHRPKTTTVIVPEPSADRNS